MPIPPSEHIHRVLIHHRRVPEAVQRECAVALDLAPLELLRLDAAFIQIIIPRLPIIPPEDIHAPIVLHARVVRPLARRDARAGDFFPGFCLQVVGEEVVVVVA